MACKYAIADWFVDDGGVAALLPRYDYILCDNCARIEDRVWKSDCSEQCPYYTPGEGVEEFPQIKRNIFNELYYG